MEVHASVFYKGNLLSLNPYYNGRYSWSYYQGVNKPLETTS